jgi:hypothetical protein
MKQTPPPIESSIFLDLVTEHSFHLPMSVDPLSSYGEHLPISNQESNQVQKLVTKSKLVDEMKLGGHVSSLWASCWS